MNIWEICDYVQNTPENVNRSILSQMIKDYGTRAQNSLSNYTLDVDISNSVDLLGKHINDLQRKVNIVDGKFYGTLLYVNTYTGFSGDPAEQEGYYVCFHVASSGADYIKVNGVTLDEDGIHIIRFKDKPYGRTATIEIKKDDNVFTDKISFDGLKLEA